MSIRSRLTGHLLGRAFVLFLVLGLVFTAWGVSVSVYLNYRNNPVSTSPIQALEEIRDATTISAGRPTVSKWELDRVATHGGWVQILDPTGAVVFSFAVPSTVPTSYAPGELVYLRNKPSEIGQKSFYTLFDSKKDRLTWVLGHEKAWDTPMQRATKPVTLVQALIGLLVVSIGVALLVSWIGAETLSRPLVHVMTWLESLAQGSFAEPLDRGGQPASRESDGTLRRPYRTYQEVIGSLETLTEQLGHNEAERERIESAREEWLTGVTHDLRTPLSSVRGYAELLGSEYEFTADETRQYAQTIKSQAQDMESLIDDLGLTFRLRAEALPLARTTVDLTEVAREAAVALANDPRSEGRTIAFAETTAREPLTVSVDVGYVTRALGNLLGNAVVHNPAGTTVTVSATREAGWARVDIADDGRGMDEATLARLFDRYYRGTASGGDAYGTGLGMAIARQLVEAHGGTVEVSSAVESGTIVRVRLPLVVG